jgi:hypothetical protein
MHSANFTAFRALAVVFAPLLLPSPPAGALEPHALINAASAKGTRAASGRRFRFMSSPNAVATPRSPQRAWSIGYGSPPFVVAA